jgi:hypothetical protein
MTGREMTYERRYSLWIAALIAGLVLGVLS